MDYIPSIDSYGSDEAVALKIKEDIETELSRMDTDVLHPSLAKNNSTVYNQDDLPNEQRILPLSSAGLKPFMDYDLSDRYTGKAKDKVGIDVDLKLLASYSQLRLLRNKALHNQVANSEYVKNLLLLESRDMSMELDHLESKIVTKRKLFAQAKSSRKKQAKDFKPINDFLGNRWTEKINELAELQITK